jgi:hypothetical protein
MPSERFTLDRAPACPSAARRAVTRVGAGLLAARLSARSPGVSNGLLWACGCLPISATHFDARARPRAVNPPPREAPASVRVCPRRAVARWREISRWSPTDTTVADRAHSAACAACIAPDGLHHRASIPGSAPPRSPAPDVPIRREFCPSGAMAETATVRHERDPGFYAGS